MAWRTAAELPVLFSLYEGSGHSALKQRIWSVLAWTLFAWTLLILSEYCNDIFPPVLLVETPNTSNAAWRHLLTDTIGHPRSSVTSVSGLCPPCRDFQCQAFTQALKDGKQRPGCAPRSCKWPRTRRVLILASGDTLLYTNETTFAYMMYQFNVLYVGMSDVGASLLPYSCAIMSNRPASCPIRKCPINWFTFPKLSFKFLVRMMFSSERFRHISFMFKSFSLRARLLRLTPTRSMLVVVVVAVVIVVVFRAESCKFILVPQVYQCINPARIPTMAILVLSEIHILYLYIHLFLWKLLLNLGDHHSIQLNVQPWSLYAGVSSEDLLPRMATFWRIMKQSETPAWFERRRMHTVPTGPRTILCR